MGVTIKYENDPQNSNSPLPKIHKNPKSNLFEEKCPCCHKKVPKEKYQEHKKYCRIYFKHVNTTSVGLVCQLCSSEETKESRMWNHWKDMHHEQVRSYIKRLKEEISKHYENIAGKYR